MEPEHVTNMLCVVALTAIMQLRMHDPAHATVIKKQAHDH
jgi:hypothetical protein